MLAPIDSEIMLIYLYLPYLVQMSKSLGLPELSFHIIGRSPWSLRWYVFKTRQVTRRVATLRLPCYLARTAHQSSFKNASGQEAPLRFFCLDQNQNSMEVHLSSELSNPEKINEHHVNGILCFCKFKHLYSTASQWRFSTVFGILISNFCLIHQ